MDEEGEDVFVRVRLGVRVLRDRGRRKETFRSLSNCEGFYNGTSRQSKHRLLTK